MNNRGALTGSLVFLFLFLIPVLIVSDTFDTSNSTTTIDGAASDSTGLSVASVGDVDSDTNADFLVTAPGASTVNGSASGRAFIVFGGSSIAASIDLETFERGDGRRGTRNVFVQSRCSVAHIL